MRLSTIIAAEFRREYQTWNSYRVNAVSTVIMWGVIGPILIVGVQQVALSHDVEFGPIQVGASLIGFLIWRLCMTVFVAIPNMVEQEARVGVLENVVLSSTVSMSTILTLRMMTRSTRSVIETLLLATVLILVFRLSLPFPPLAVLITILTLAGTCGIGLALAGAALMHKSVSGFVGLISLLALFVSGAAIPLNSLTIFTLLKYSVPTAWGIDLLRNVVLYEQDFGMISGELLGLIFQTLLMIIIGYILFHKSFLKVRHQGQLGVY